MSVSRTVFKTFSVNYGVTFKAGLGVVQGH